MCLRETFAAIVRKRDKRPLENGDNGENANGIDINAPAVTASPSKENKEPPSVSETHGEDSSNDSKSVGKTSAETRKGSESQEEETEEEKWAWIQERARFLEKDNERIFAECKAKGHIIENYYSNDDLHDYYD